MKANMHDAKSKLSQLVDAAAEGEEVIIAKSGTPVVQLIPYSPATKRVFGSLKGQVHMSDDFDSELVNNEISNLFGAE